MKIGLKYKYLEDNVQKKRIGHYQYDINKIIGRGANSFVYQGVDINTKEKICIKVIKPLNNYTDQMLLKNEISALSTIRHKNVIRLIDYFQHQGSHYIITELCQRNLKQFLKEKKKLSEEEALEVFLQILMGYKQIREKRFIHRDLKDENILVLKGKMKIADFGNAIKMENVMIKQTYNVGTPAYMSPQVIQYNVYSEASDIWSLGIILYLLLQGYTPFQTTKHQAQVISQIKKQIKIIGCNPKIWQIITACLTLQPYQRIKLSNLIQKVESLLFQMKIQKQQIIKFRAQIRKIGIIQNQINYIKYLQYLILLSKKIRPSLISQRVIFICQYNIRMKICLISKLVENLTMEKSKWSNQLEQIQTNHSFQLKIPQQTGSAHMFLFKTINITYNQSLLWQSQAEFKNCLKQFYKLIKGGENEEYISFIEPQLKFFDYLMTAFILNSYIIQCQENLYEFSNKSYLDVILSSPSNMSLKVYKNMNEKYHNLKLQ